MPFFLYTAISILENAFDEFALGDELAIIDDLILTKYPVLGSVALDDADIRLDALIGSGAEFYAVFISGSDEISVRARFTASAVWQCLP